MKKSARKTFIWHRRNIKNTKHKNATLTLINNSEQYNIRIVYRMYKTGESLYRSHDVQMLKTHVAGSLILHRNARVQRIGIHMCLIEQF